MFRQYWQQRRFYHLAGRRRRCDFRRPSSGGGRRPVPWYLLLKRGRFAWHRRFGLAWGTLLVSNAGFAEVPTCLALENNRSIRGVFEKAQVSENELLARLVLAEGVSTNLSKSPQCKELGAEVFEAIAWGVMNRVRMGRSSTKLARRYGDSLYGVVFKKAQFNPAVSRRSRFSAYFRCPSDLAGWQRFWKWAVQGAQTAIQGNGSPFLQEEWEKKHQVARVSHFYYPLSEQATPKPPAWADASEGSKTLVRNLKVKGRRIPSQCIWFFRNERPWILKAGNGVLKEAS